jgi:aspartyl-tRNA(Asn)/glutamyl-tRNA(Gln) amidotransferase subunit A
MGGMESDVGVWSAAETAQAFAARTLSPVEATRAALRRIAAFNGAVNAYCLVDEDGALEAARASEARWMRGAPLGAIDGVTTSVKDLMLAKGWPTRRASKLTPTTPATEDAPSVARLREAGAVLLGKTTSPEIGWKGVTDSPLFGVTRNPWNVRMTSGGSSGGAAVAAALGMGCLHLGTDGGGSIRMPAGFTGIFGLKPTYGRVPVYPLSTFGTLSHAGPMTRTVGDAALMMNVIARKDARDWFALPPDVVDYSAALGDGLKGLRIAYSPTLGYAKVAPEIAAIVAEAARTFSALGVQVDIVDKVCDDPREDFIKLWTTGCALAARSLPRERRGEMDPGLQAFIGYGESVPHMDYAEADYARGKLGVVFETLFGTYDLLLTPSLPMAAFPTENQVADPATQRHWIDWTPFTFPFNMTRQPAASMPCGFTREGLPVGLQIVGPLNADTLVLRAACAYEHRHPIRLPEAPRGHAS